MTALMAWKTWPVRAALKRVGDRLLPWRRTAARMAALEAELAAQREVVNACMAREVQLVARLNAHVMRTGTLVETISPVLKGHAAQLLELSWWRTASTEVSSVHRQREVARVHERLRSEWAAQNIPPAPDPAEASAAAVDELATVREAQG